MAFPVILSIAFAQLPLDGLSICSPTAVVLVEKKVQGEVEEVKYFGLHLQLTSPGLNDLVMILLRATRLLMMGFPSIGLRLVLPIGERM